MKSSLKSSLNETVILKGKKTWLFFTVPILVALFSLLGMYYDELNFDTILSYFLFNLTVVLIYLYRYRKTEFIITDKRVYGRTGFLKFHEMSSPINRVQNVEIIYTFMGKIFHYGTIRVTTVNGIYMFKLISNAEEFRDKLFEMITY